MAELVPGIGQRQRRRAFGKPLPRKQARQLLGISLSAIQPQPPGERVIEGQQARRRRPYRPGRCVKARHVGMKTIVESKIHRRPYVDAARDDCKGRESGVRPV